MRRDQILRQPAVISGNLPPADLPNPHEPIRSEETMDGLASWSTPQSTSGYDSDDNDDEDHEVTSPFHSDAVSMPTANGKSPTNNTLTSYSPVSTSQRNWLVRLLHLGPSKSN